MGQRWSACLCTRSWVQSPAAEVERRPGDEEGLLRKHEDCHLDPGTQTKAGPSPTHACGPRTEGLKTG